MCRRFPRRWNSGWLAGVFETNRLGVLGLSDKGGVVPGLGRFLLASSLDVFSGAMILKRFSAHRVLGLYGLLNVAICLLIFLKLGWLSVGCVFLSYFFMSIMFPTIFALGIHGLGARAQEGCGYIVMAIMGGAIVPKADGGGGRPLWRVAWLYRAAGLLHLRDLLRFQLVEVQQRRLGWIIGLADRPCPLNVSGVATSR